MEIFFRSENKYYRDDKVVDIIFSVMTVGGNSWWMRPVHSSQSEFLFRS